MSGEVVNDNGGEKKKQQLFREQYVVRFIKNCGTLHRGASQHLKTRCSVLVSILD